MYMSRKELAYLWINKTSYNCFENNEFNFSPNYIFHFDKDSSCLTKEDICDINIFNQQNISNISALIGNNGVGKTTLLDFIQNLASFPVIMKNNNEPRYKRYIEHEIETKSYICVFLIDGKIKIVNNTCKTIYYQEKEYFPFKDLDGNSVKKYFENYSRIIISMNSRVNNYSRLIGHYESIFRVDRNAIYKDNEYFDKRFIDCFIAPYYLNKIKKKFDYLDYLRFDSMNNSTFDSSENIRKVNVYVLNFLNVLAVDYNDNESEASENEVESRNFVLKEFNKINDGPFTIKNYDFLIKLNFVCEVLYCLNFNLGDNRLSWDEAYKKACAYIEEYKGKPQIYDYFKNAIKEIDMFTSAKHSNINISYIDNYTDLAYSICSVFEKNSLTALFEHIRTNKTSFIAKYLYFDFNMSEGELVKLDLETFMFYISHIDEYNLNSSSNKVILYNNIILMLDECDVSLHPNGKREYLNNVIMYINKNFVGKNVQVILTTHSPIILSDLPCQNVLFLKNDDKVKEVYRGEKRTFGANIFDLYNDAFFFSNGCTIGDFASNYISDLYDETKKELSNGKISDDTMKKIELIGDSFLREQFYALRKNVVDNDVDSLINLAIQNINDDEIKKELKDIIGKLNDKAKSSKR